MSNKANIFSSHFLSFECAPKRIILELNTIIVQFKLHEVS